VLLDASGVVRPHVRAGLGVERPDRVETRADVDAAAVDGGNPEAASVVCPRPPRLAGPTVEQHETVAGAAGSAVALGDQDAVGRRYWSRCPVFPVERPQRVTNGPTERSFPEVPATTERGDEAAATARAEEGTTGPVG
jgi:hypothetical protein